MLKGVIEFPTVCCVACGYSQVVFPHLPLLPKISSAHTCTHLLRVYPHAGRFNSSNFEPMRMIAAGVQCVALNYQSHDLPMQVYRGF